MTENTVSTPELTGKMFLYGQPELLSLEAHGDLGLVRLDKPFEFASKIKAVPIVSTEFSSIQKHYPIAFTGVDNPTPVAVVGLADEVNVFVKDGFWDESCYIPSYLRRHPFALATTGEDQAALVVDVASERVGKNPDFPFFKDGEVTQETRSMLDFCGQFTQEVNRTVNLCNLLKELDLLVSQTATRTNAKGEEEHVANFVSIDGQKVAALPGAKLEELMQNGALAAIFSQAFSMENWNRLFERRDRHPGA
ncbi:MAG: SapC family protein [Pseudomonadales bacterium]|nr:SapC family protein [Pseudomonadales bacterium]